LNWKLQVPFFDKMLFNFGLLGVFLNRLRMRVVSMTFAPKGE